MDSGDDDGGGDVLLEMGTLTFWADAAWSRGLSSRGGGQEGADEHQGIYSPHGDVWWGIVLGCIIMGELEA